MAAMTDEQGQQQGPQHAEPEPAQEPRGGASEPEARHAKHKRTRTSVAWASVIVALVVLVFLLIFILQNLESTTVYFLGFSGSLPTAVAMLFSAIGGAGLIALLGVARMIQLRRAARVSKKLQQ